MAVIAGPANAETLVMVSPPPRLDAAVRTSLAPWRVKIIVVEMASGTPADLALAQGAGFVVWADDGELVLWDADAGAGERRDIPVELDDANAAALALSIKTWMHLGVPPGDAVDVDSVEPAPTPSESPIPPPRVRAEAATGVRGNMAADGGASLRAAFGAVARTGPIEIALDFELGSAADASSGAVFGEMSIVEVSVHARWPLPVARSLTLSPTAGVVFGRSSFSGRDDRDRPYDAAGTSAGVDAGAMLAWRWSRLVVAGELGATYVLVSQELQDRDMRLATPAHIEPRGLVRVGLVLR
jgi:hypothetical protein